MMLQLHGFSAKIIPKLAPALRHIVEKIAILLIPLPLFMLFTGTEGIIENDSPETLASISSLSHSFFNSFGMHILILSGALGVTFLIWFVTQNIWNNSEDESEK